MNSISIKDLMLKSGVAFGTSGARGLVTQMTDEVCMAYTVAFLRHLEAAGLRTRVLLVAGDRRPSTPRIMRAVAQAAIHLGYEVRSAGFVPSPALALWGMTLGVPTVMVTGSHIPDDRNGLKFTTESGEITKADEAGIVAQTVDSLPQVDTHGMLVAPRELPPPDDTAAQLYQRRYLDAFGSEALVGMRLGVYGHSAVGRELLVDLYRAMGAEVVPLGFSERFVPVDTEAIRPEDHELAGKWARAERFSALVSTDGDSDRPLFSDENGQWLRGDVTGIFTAQFLGADGVAVPVSCNTALEKSGWFSQVARTRIGSPFVIAAFSQLGLRGAAAVVGYEANGGFFTHSPLSVPRPDGSTGVLPPLPTRDPVIVHLALLMLAKRHNCPVSALSALLPARFTASGRDQSFATAKSQALLAHLAGLAPAQLAEHCGLGEVAAVDQTDGLRISFASLEVLHLRPSGNAPELRCYAEASSEARAEQLVTHGLELARRLAARA